MGSLLSAPVTDKTNETGEGNNLRYGLASMQGWRNSMEDSHCVSTSLPGRFKDWSFFGVFDGHAGSLVSEMCASELLYRIVESREFKSIDPESPNEESVINGIRAGFLDLDEEMRRLPQIENGLDRSGSTAICVLITPRDFFFANCGDSRGILVSEGEVRFSTADHKPGRPSERKRIENAGGSVIVERVNGNLAVSRSLGDYTYKSSQNLHPTEQIVSPEPEITVLPRCPDKDQMIVLACDGVWDVVINDALSRIVSERMTCHDDLSHVCNEVLDYCLYNGSSDNMSMVLVAFEKAPKLIPENRIKDQELEEKVKNVATEMVESEDSKVAVNELLVKIRGKVGSGYANHAVHCKGAIVQRIVDEHAPPPDPNGAGSNSPDASTRSPSSASVIDLDPRLSLIQQLLASCQGIMTNGGARITLRPAATAASTANGVEEIGVELTEVTEDEEGQNGSPAGAPEVTSVGDDAAGSSAAGENGNDDDTKGKAASVKSNGNKVTNGEPAVAVAASTEPSN